MIQVINVSEFLQFIGITVLFLQKMLYLHSNWGEAANLFKFI